MRTRSKWGMTGDVIWVVSIVLASLFTFAPSLTLPLLEGWDDNLYVLENFDRLRWTHENIAHWFSTTIVSNYQPVTMLSYMVDYAIWGTNSVGYHLQNLAWHTVACLGLLGMMRHLGLKPAIAGCLTLIFAVHPQRVESVVWVAERKDVLCAAFYFWALAWYIRGRSTPGMLQLVPALALFVLALLSKPMAISLPIVLALYEYYECSRTLQRPPIWRLLPFFVLAGVCVPITLAAQSNAIEVDIDPVRQLAVVLHNLSWYGFKTAVPLDMNPIYPRLEWSAPALALIGVTALAMIGLVIIAVRHSRDLRVRTALAVVGAYAASLLPVSGIVPLGAIDVADRYSYIPSAFLLIGIGAAIMIMMHRPFAADPVISPDHQPDAAGQITCKVLRYMMVVTALYIAALTSSTRTYIGAWRDLYTLTQWSYETGNTNPVALGMLADIELQRSNFERVRLLAAELEDIRGLGLTSAHIKANQVKAEFLRAACDHGSGRYRMALPALLKLTRHFAVASLDNILDQTSIYGMIGECHDRLGNPDDAIEWYTAALARTPDAFEILMNRGVALYNAGTFVRAADDFRQAVKQRPADARAAHNLAQAVRHLQ